MSFLQHKYIQIIFFFFFILFALQDLYIFFFKHYVIFFLFFFKFVIYICISILPMLLSVVLAIAFFVHLERKVMASMQRRRGPNMVGILGLLQPFADAFKAIFKETLIPGHANKLLFLFAPIFTFFSSLMLWSVFPFFKGVVFLDIDINILFVFAISSLGVYGIIFSGWSSNSKYAFLGGLRSAAQMISYEIVIGLIICCVVMFAEDVTLSGIVDAQRYCWFVFPLLPLWIIFCIAMLAETNRSPFDLPEAEAELVAGYNVEYAGLSFALFFLGEYGNMLFISGLSCIFFFGGWHLPLMLQSFVSMTYFVGMVCFSFKLSFHVFFFIWVRAAFPRFRYDQLMRLNWKIIIPFLISFITFEAALLSYMS